MNKAAEGHLARAAEHVAKGDKFYRKAAEEIIAAKEADPTLSNGEIGERFEKSEMWVRDVVMRVTNPSARSGLYQERQSAGGRAVAKKVLRDEPEKVVPEIAEALANPSVRRQVIEHMAPDVAEDTMDDTRSAVVRSIETTGAEQKASRRAVREEHHEDPSAVHYRIVKLDLAKAEDALVAAIRTSRDTGWPDDRIRLLLNRLTTIKNLVELFELSILKEVEVDWDEQLAALTSGDDIT